MFVVRKIWGALFSCSIHFEIYPFVLFTTNYRPVPLLLIRSKIFELFLKKNRLLNSNHSWFTPNDFCINYLISIIHNIFKALDANPSLEVCGVLLDLSIAFEGICYESLLCKLDNNGIDGNFCHLVRYKEVLLLHP